LHAIKSVLAQSFNDYEIVVSDNSDGSNETILGEFCSSTSSANIKYTRTGGLSMVQNWNNALDIATGDNIIVIEDKMVMYPHALELIRNTFSRSSSRVVYWNYDVVDDTNNRTLLIKKSNIKGRLIKAHCKLNKLRANIVREVFKIPRALCCSMPKSLILEINKNFDACLFEDISPDMTSGFKLLHSIDDYWNCGESLFAVTTSKIGNGKELFESPKNERYKYMMGKSNKTIAMNNVECDLFTVTNIIIDDYNKIAKKAGKIECIHGGIYWRNITKELVLKLLEPSKVGVEVKEMYRAIYLGCSVFATLFNLSLISCDLFFNSAKKLIKGEKSKIVEINNIEDLYANIHTSS